MVNFSKHVVMIIILVKVIIIDYKPNLLPNFINFIRVSSSGNFLISAIWTSLALEE